MTDRARLVGDGLDDPANAGALLDAAALFGVPCLFRDSRGLADRYTDGRLSTVDTDALLGRLRPIVAVENAPGAVPVFAAGPAPGSATVVVGNERRGIRPDVLREAATCVDIPMAGAGVNTLNVAAAAAVALYYLLGGAPGRRVRSGRSPSRRPEVLLLGPSDHVETGSTLRSAAALGWRTVSLDDRHAVWFGTPRPVRAEGRAAARAHRNPLRVVGVPTDQRLTFARVVVARPGSEGPPLSRVTLTGGPDTLVVIPDNLDTDVDWHRYGTLVEHARIDLPAHPATYRYRLTASIVLAEVSRQLGPRPARRPRRRPRYRSAVTVAPPDVDVVTPEDLRSY